MRSSQEALTLQRDPIKSEKPCTEFSGNTEWESELHNKATTAHLNAPYDAKHHSRVSAIGKLTVAAQAFLWHEAPLSGKDVVECVDRLLCNLTGKRNVPFWC